MRLPSRVRVVLSQQFTDEKLYIVAGPEFEELEGYIVIFLKALYGLESSGKRWAEVIHDILRDMKFLPSKAAPCIWLRKAPNLRCYEYIAVYVDDLCIAAQSPSAIIQIFKSKYYLKVKGDGKLTYHLGADYFEDPDGTFVSHNRNVSKSTGWTLQTSLLVLWMDENLNQQSNKNC